MQNHSLFKHFSAFAEAKTPSAALSAGIPHISLRARFAWRSGRRSVAVLPGGRGDGALPFCLAVGATERCRFAVAPHFPTMPQSLLCLPQSETFPTCADAKKKLRACGAFHRVFLPCLRRCQTSGSSLSPAARDSSVGGASCSSPRIKRS